jgi:hypothetical protein
VPGYTCERCGTAWTFTNCERCGQRFHMPHGTTTWTCPNCGFHHAPPAGEHPAPAHLAPGPPPGPAGPASGRRLRLGSIAVAGIAVVVIGAVLLTRGGSTTPPASPTPDAIQALCLHLRDLQTARVDALTRVADAIGTDADAIEASGDAQAAAAVRKLRQAVLGYRDALASQSGDDAAAAAAVADALADPRIPCG